MHYRYEFWPQNVTDKNRDSSHEFYCGQAYTNTISKAQRAKNGCGVLREGAASLLPSS